MLILDSASAISTHDAYAHRTECPPDDGSPISFRWHFQRGILKPRMSGYELAGFLLSQMPSIVPFLEQPRVRAEFEAMLTLMATTPRSAMDRLLPWIRTIIHQEEDDIVSLSLYDQTEQPIKPYVVMP